MPTLHVGLGPNRHYDDHATVELLTAKQVNKRPIWFNLYIGPRHAYGSLTTAQARQLANALLQAVEAADRAADLLSEIIPD